MPAAAPRAEKAMWAEALTLVGKFKVIDSPQNVAYNYRMIYMNWIIREYRGELLYDLAAQDDPRALERIIDAIVAAAATDPVRATDFASFLNKAYFDGMLGKHNAGELKSMAKKFPARAARPPSAPPTTRARNRRRARQRQGPDHVGRVDQWRRQVAACARVALHACFRNRK